MYAGSEKATVVSTYGFALPTILLLLLMACSQSEPSPKAVDQGSPEPLEWPPATVQPIPSQDLFLRPTVVTRVVTETPPPPTATQNPKPTSPPATMPTLASLPDGGLVYGDPEGRFTFPFPLAGEWTPVESDGSYAQFRLADPALEIFVVTSESDDFKPATDAALREIGVDPSALSEMSRESYPPWLLRVYSFEDGMVIGVFTRVLDDVTIALIANGEFSVMNPLKIPFLAAIDGFTTMPLAEYLAFQPPAPSTVEDIKDLRNIEFYSGRTKLVGRLTLPEGEGPFPAIVYTGPGSGRTTRFDHNPYWLQPYGFAIFSYDKRGGGDSEGVYSGVDVETSEWILPQLADDALAAVAFLQGLEEINSDQIGLAGWSQNGWVIPVAAAKSDTVAFTLINGGATVSLGEEDYWSELAGDGGTISASKRDELTEPMAAFDGPRGFDPRPYIEAMSVPGLWIWGDRDGSVPARESKAILEEIIEQYDKPFSIIYYPDLGHGAIGPPREIADWIYAHLEE